MKKTIFFIFYLVVIGPVFAQVTIVDTTTGTLPATNTNYSEPSAESNRFGTTDYILSASRFTLSQTTQLLTAEFLGENLGNNFTPNNFSVFIVNNSSTGLPKFNSNVTNSTPIENLFEAPVNLLRIPLNQGFTITQFNMASKRTDIAINFTVANGNNSVILPAGTYWMIAAQHVPDGSPGEPTFYWGWLGSSVTSPMVPKKLSNTFFSSGWSNINFSNGNATELAWKLTGNVNLSLDEERVKNIAIYPNPSSDLVYLDLPKNITCNSVEIYNSFGQQIDVKFNPNQNNIDISNLCSGVYNALIVTNSGTTNKKIIKN